MRRSLVGVLAGIAVLAPAASAAASHGGSPEPFIRSAVEHPDGTATFPLHRGISQGRTVYYLLLDSSDGERASRIGVNRSQKLAHAAGTGAVQHVTVGS